MFCCYQPLLGTATAPASIYYWSSLDSSVFQNRTLSIKFTRILGRAFLSGRETVRVLREKWDFSVWIPDGQNSKNHWCLREWAQNTLPCRGPSSHVERGGLSTQTPSPPLGETTAVCPGAVLFSLSLASELFRPAEMSCWLVLIHCLF